MSPICDYHMHTPLCGHASGSPEEYAEHALKVGLKEIGFSDHAPFVHYVDPSVTMNVTQLPEYQQMIESVIAEYHGRLKIKLALEADFIPGYEKKTQSIIDNYPYDYIIGSVHFIKEWGFDNPSEREKWEEQDTDAIYQDYYELLRQSAESGLFDIMGHVDLVKKFGHRSKNNMADEVQKTAETFKKFGVAIEINTSGLRKPVKEMYPSLWNLEIYYAAGVPLTFGSDAHNPKDVGKDFTQATQLAKAAGYKEYVTFKNRKIEQTIKL
ncbi:Histidinol-phosphatase [hydrothermal vent metagenome]|uniref:histidinol-phosphatase n=1 Tax=hydrothermal vent metagenome TaxID=652676 RepID=A0A3B1D6Y5_9ZZZZ